MKLTSSELKQVAAYGLGGTFIASAFHLMKIYKQRRTHIQLETEVESLPDDPSFLLLVHTVERRILEANMNVRQFRNLQKNFTRLVTSIDRLMFVKDSVKRFPSKSGMENIEFAFLQLRRIQNLCQKLVSNASDSMMPQEAAMLAFHLKKIAAKAEDHFKNTLFLLRKSPIDLNVE